MLKIRKPPEKALIVTAWFLAGILFALISGLMIYDARAQGLRPDDHLTTAELCRDSCNREHNVCVESSSARVTSNYNDENAFVGLKANCNRDLGRCLDKCGMAPDGARQDPSIGATGN